MQPGTAATIRIALAVSLGGFIFGFDASVISGTIRFLTAEFGLSEIQLGLVVGAPTLGGIVSAGLVGPLSDLYGRKKLLMAVALLYSLSAGLSAFAPNYELLVLARFVGGLAFGSLGLAPVYISEVAAARSRGRMVSINQFNIVVGFSAAYFVNYLILQFSQGESAWVQMLGLDMHTWRWMLGIEILPALAWVIMLLLVPETPRWLIINGREEEGRRVLSRLTLDKPLEEELADIRASRHGQVQSVSSRLREVFSPALRLALIVGLLLATAQQITGINAVYFYAPSIFEQTGIGANAAFAQAVAVGVTNVIFTILSMLLIDRLGRKPLLIMGLTGILVSMTLCAMAFQEATYRLDTTQLERVEDGASAARLQPLLGREYTSDVAFKRAIEQAVGRGDARALEGALMEGALDINATLVLVGILGFVASFAFSLGPVMWVMLPEIFPNHCRGFAMAVTGVVNSGVSFAVQFIFPWELNRLGAALTFAGYAGFALLALGLVLWLVPETRNKSLEDLELELAGAAI